MYFQIQLVHPFQQKVKIVVHEVSDASGPVFDSVTIGEDEAPRFPKVSFLVPLGRGEALAEALRKVIEP